ncbi:MAG: hypothetical protein JXB38_09440 [Anaerolineales bacterium]|nr:hypothetical protein [Anaerolineales bacterium]
MVAAPMIKKNDFAGKLKKAVDAVIEAQTGELVARLEDLQRVLDGDFPSIENPDDMGETRDLLESAQIFMNVFAAKAQELRSRNRIDEAKVLERFMARYSKLVEGDDFTGWTDTLYRRYL